MHVRRHRSDCVYPDVFGVFCFCRDGDDGAALFRGAELDRSLAGVPEDRQLREIRKHTRTQSQFLRLRRTKIGLRDFRTVKVIGKGAFGEVSFWPWAVSIVLSSSSPALFFWLSIRICPILVTVFSPCYHMGR